MNIKQAKELLRLAYKPECRRSQVILLLGSPGIGKTQCITELAQELGVHAEFLICSQMLPNEICGSGIPSKDGKVWEMYDPAWVSRLKDGDILVLDELLTAGQQILNACLTMCQARILPSGHKLPDIMIVAAANPLGSPELLPLAIRQRFQFVQIGYDAKSLDQYLKEKYGWTEPLQSHIRFSGKSWNVTTPRSLEKLVVMAIEAWKDDDRETNPASGTDVLYDMVVDEFGSMVADSLWKGVKSWKKRDDMVRLDEACEATTDEQLIEAIFEKVDIIALVKADATKKIDNGMLASKVEKAAHDIYDAAASDLSREELDTVEQFVINQATDEIVTNNSPEEIFKEIVNSSDLSTIIGTLEEYGLWDNILEQLKEMEVLNA